MQFFRRMFIKNSYIHNKKNLCWKLFLFSYVYSFCLQMHSSFVIILSINYYSIFIHYSFYKIVVTGAGYAHGIR